MQKNNAICSIATVSYMAYVGLLNQSLRQAGHREKHYVLIVDDPIRKHKEIWSKFDFQPIYLDELNLKKGKELIENYSAFELCNVLKPFFMEWLLKKHPEINILVYLDSDLYFYSQMGDIFLFLEENEDISVAITPNLNDYESYLKRNDYVIEKMYFFYGLYNGGFYVMKNNQKALEFLDWLSEKLFLYGFNAPWNYMFVDQKILDFAPILFDYVGIYRNKAYNIGPWNHFPGLIKESNGKYYAGEENLVFYHFSQTSKETQTNNVFFLSKEESNLFNKMLSEYKDRLENLNHSKIRTIPYGYINKYKKSDLASIVPFASEDEVLRATQELLENKLNELKGVYASRTWKLAWFMRNVTLFLLPNTSVRRRAVSFLWKNLLQIKSKFE